MSFCLWLCQQQTRVRSSESIKLWHGERKLIVLVSILFHVHTDTLIDSLSLARSHFSMWYARESTHILVTLMLLSLAIGYLHSVTRFAHSLATFCVHLFHMNVPFSFSRSCSFSFTFLVS